MFQVWSCCLTFCFYIFILWYYNCINGGIYHLLSLQDWLGSKTNAVFNKPLNKHLLKHKLTFNIIDRNHDIWNENVGTSKFIQILTSQPCVMIGVYSLNLTMVERFISCFYFIQYFLHWIHLNISCIQALCIYSSISTFGNYLFNKANNTSICTLVRCVPSGPSRSWM